VITHGKEIIARDYYLSSGVYASLFPIQVAIVKGARIKFDVNLKS